MFDDIQARIQDSVSVQGIMGRAELAWVDEARVGCFTVV